MIEIRPARREDAELVSQCVLASVNLYDFVNDSIEKDVALFVCGQDDTLYSWKNARIALVDGVPAGCLVSYGGDGYARMREITFKYFKDAGREMTGTDMETGPGEYYLDSMAIRPEFRGLDIGHMLMQSAIDEALANGFSAISLIVETDKPKLQDYYAQLGFVPEEQINAFGDTYNRMIFRK